MTNALLPRKSFIGFDGLWSELDKISKQLKDTYPPFNVLNKDGKSYNIELAVAGFSQPELSIELKDNILTVAGSKATELEDIMYDYKGISTKKFLKTFRLSEYTEVVGANLHDGILNITLNVKTPEEKSPKLINIQTDNPSIGK